MFRKANFKLLVLVLVILTGLTVLTILLKNKGTERTFRSELFIIDSTKISSIFISSLSIPDQGIEIFKQGENWHFYSNNKEIQADIDVMTGMVAELLHMKPKRVAATSKEKWTEFEVTDSLGTHVKVKEGDMVVADFIIGKFSYQQSKNPYNRQGTITSYIRLDGENEVYAVADVMNMTFNKNPNQLRNKKLTNLDMDNISRLTFSYPADSSFILSKQEDKWMINGLIADSVETDKYLNSVSRLISNNIVEDAAQRFNISQPAYSLKIDGNNMSPLLLDAFVADSIENFVITSSGNADTWFSGSKANLFDRIFISPSKLIAEKVVDNSQE